MNRKRLKKSSLRTTRSLLVEGLETRSLMTAVILPPWETSEARDDSFVLKVDSSENTLRVLDNDFGWWNDRWYSTQTSNHSFAPTSLTAANVSFDWDTLPDYRLVPPTPPIQILSVTAPKHGTVRISADKTTLVFTPEKGFEGVEQFEYTIEGVAPEKSKARVNIHVVQPVLAVDDWYQVKTNDSLQKLNVTRNDRSNASNISTAQFVPSYAIDLIIDVTKPFVSPYNIVSLGTASHGGKLVISADAKSIEYQPADGFEGLETFIYTIENGDGDRDVGQVSVRVGSSEASNVLAKQESSRQKWLESVLNRQQWSFGAANNSEFYPTYYDRYSPVTFSSNRVVSDSATPASSRYEAGNNQLAGVDEADIVETDGDYLYVISRQTLNRELIIIDARDQAKPKIQSQMAIDGRIIAMHKLGDRLVLVADNSKDPRKVTTAVTILDVSDRTSPKVLRSSELDGDYRESRLIGDKLYVFTNSVLALPSVERVPNQPTGAAFNETGRQYLARLGEQLYSNPKVTIVNRDGSGTTTGNSSFSVDLQTAANVFNDGWGAILSVSSFDVDSNAAGPFDFDIVGKSGYANLVVTMDTIFVLGSNWNRTSFQPEIDISSFAFSTSDGTVNPQATGSVEGYIQNRFSVGTYQGDLQIVHNAGILNNQNNLSVLRRNGTTWTTVGKIENIAPGEQIQSARFAGDRAFLVTFRRVDPLFVIDLADATKPQILGELKIPGYSQYLHPIDSTHLMGIGRDADEQTGLFGSLQVSLFDITDLSKPKLQSRFEYQGGRQTFSPLVESSFGLSNNQALGYFPEAGILALPLHHREDWIWRFDGVFSGSIDPKLPEVEVLRIDPVKGIEKLGEIQSTAQVDRTLRIGDYLYVLASDRIIVTELTKPNTVVAELQIPPPTSTGSGNTTGSNSGTGGTGTKTELDKEAIEARKRFHNKSKPCDVNGDGVIAPIDALNVINFLRGTGTTKVSEMIASRTLSAQSVDAGLSQQDLQWDVNEDGEITPLDVLVVINQLRREGNNGDGEAMTDSQISESTNSGADMSDVERRRSRNFG